MMYVKGTATIFAAFAVCAVIANQRSVIVNSTDITELKLTIADEDKTGAVAYVYAVESTDLSSSESPATVVPHLGRQQNSEELPSAKKKIDSSTKTSVREKCVTRVIEKMKGDERTVSYNATLEEAKSAGKTIIDSICEGDEGFDSISKVNLANLGDDIYHLP